jgi:hypothetical protein
LEAMSVLAGPRLRAGDGQPFHNPVREELPTIRQESPHALAPMNTDLDCHKLRMPEHSDPIPFFFICLHLAGTLICSHVFTNVISHPRVHVRIVPDHNF